MQANPLRLAPASQSVLTLVLIASWAASPAAAGDSIRLAPRAAAGGESAGEAYVEFTAESKQTFAGPDGKSMEVESRSVFGMMMQARAAGAGLDLVYTFDRLAGALVFRTEPGSEGVRSAFDSDDPESEDASPDHRAAFGAVRDASLTVALDAGGVSASVEGADAIRARLERLGPQNFVAKSLADEEFSDAGVKSAFGEALFVLLPYRDARVGETWSKVQHDVYPQVGRVLVTYECTLERVDTSPDGDVGVVAFKGRYAKDPDEKAPPDKRLGEIEGEFAGTARFSASLGRFIEIRREMTARVGMQPWWSRDLTAPLMRVDVKLTGSVTTTPAAERVARREQIARRVAEVRAQREAEEAAAMSGPVEPPTPPNAPVAWLQWGGPKRNFCVDATGLSNRWPEGGPRRLWERPLGDGYSAILCDGDALYTMYSLRDKEDPYQGDEVVVALDVRSGRTLWEHRYPAPWPKDLQMEFGPGPHSTPLLVGDRLFTVGSTARFHCLDRASGSVLWSKDLLAEHKAALHMRGYGSSPLAYRGNVLLPIRSEPGFAVMAFSQADGTLAWSGGDFEPGYASLLLIEAFGKEQLVAFGGKALCGLDPASGATLWSFDHPTQFGANISTPVWNAEDQHFFISSAYGMGSRGVKLENAGGTLTAREAWQTGKMKIQHADAVRVGDWIYGSSGDFGPAFLCCVNAKTGEFGWRQRGIAKANVVYADGKLIVLDEDGTLLLVKADPDRYRVLAKAPRICDRTAWTVPTLYGRTLFVRDRQKVRALDLGVHSGG